METGSAGLISDADAPLSIDQLQWCDMLFLMEKAHRRQLMPRYRNQLKRKRVVLLDIRDDCAFMQPELIAR